PGPLHRLRPLLGDPGHRRDGSRRHLASGPGIRALRHPPTGPRSFPPSLHRRGPRRGLRRRLRAARRLRTPRDPRTAVRLRRRSAGRFLQAAQLRAARRRLHGHTRQRHAPGVASRSRRRRTPEDARAGGTGALFRSALPGHDPGTLRLVCDPRHPDAGGELHHLPAAGRARARVGGAHEPPRNSGGERGMEDARPSPGKSRAAGRTDRAVRSNRRPEMSRKFTRAPLWYKDAVIYELRVGSFADSNDDGIGDFRGLTSRLEYLQDLGVTAIWLLPFYPSPGKDDGYDIADYYDVDPTTGPLDDFREFLEEAHRRGLYVITELVVNHTSDQHPWFQRARRAPPGSIERNFYVWSDTADRYKEARIIFKDFERSNWQWDDVAQAYYWHRFYSHQPDLNFDNPAVHEAVFDVVDFWLDMGVDGLRLDAIPYLYEREGTNCENLPETHEFLRKLRRHVDEKY